ncbi:MAG: hypothetical protein JSW01_00480 [Candidatus Bathyarchaeota archaeon]|nr:MAG: hypothetical protein JSW01_00480 [Candidatus Bathyarchaeota archaeon]
MTRTYYGVISDALEACFSFEEGLDPDAYCIDIQIPDSEGLAEILERAITIEEKIQKAYSDAARLSEGLMADIPRVFSIIAGKREERIAKLRDHPR